MTCIPTTPFYMSCWVDLSRRIGSRVSALLQKKVESVDGYSNTILTGDGIFYGYLHRTFGSATTLLF